ncbi:DNA internalization-related competence protein ComEC/Rec2 [Salinicoccus sp. ID82-1]|uniref:DNA internalization-related competence protein ComEC/Rec2 n=1 Tax=Salinicoccus sp. ID82-1 TaxID=2820269 RepID=UPI001F008F02|nr:DNA internalization-related competence protein ComEC/Rec2 [Salinicoccus sp. ID82-1]MCG1008901.1 DNA internalization-related competence protein ComEC/Rec2 [Salinicoccus sp. ID82-1]
MIPFLILLAILNGYILAGQPVIGLFFIITTSVISYRKLGGLFLILHCLVAAIISMAVFMLPEKTPPPVDSIPGFTVTGYKYYQDSIAHTATYNDRRYDLYLEESVKLPVGYACSGPFEVHMPAENRNFIKVDDRMTMNINDLAGRIYEDTIDAAACQPVEKTAGMRLAEIRDGYMERVLGATVHDYKFDILTLSVGNKAYITSEFFDSLQKLGIYHLYVISGTHIAFISGILFFLLNRLRLDITTIRLVMMASLILFLFLNFFSPSVFRAVFMTVVLLATSFTRHKPYLAIISLSAIIQILLNPWIVYHAGFQLSYITTFLIILSRNYWSQYGFFTQLFGITLIAEFSTLVILLHQFNELSISGIMMNLIFVPLFTFLIFPMVILFNVMAFTHLPVFMDVFYSFTFGMLRQLITVIAEGMRHRISVANLNFFWLILLVTLTYWMIRTLCLKQFRRLVVLTICFGLSIYMIDRLSYQDYTVTMVDVGQGDAFVIEDHRSGTVILLDTGGQFYFRDAGRKLSERTVLPYLKESGVDRIDMLILSHFDLDHVGESHHIMTELPVDHVYLNANDPGFEAWYAGVPRDFEGKIINALESREIRAGGIVIERLFPDATLQEVDTNRNSLVLKVHTGSFSFLFTGDTDVEMETQMMSTQGTIEADVLKLAHHGSDTSTGDHFLAHSTFTYGLISAGLDNRYDHPHAEVLGRVRDLRLLDTTKHGMVRFTIRNDRMCIETKLDETIDHCIKKRAE